MNPYEVLGVGPATPIEEIEAAYRLRLREWHPDLHQAEGPEAVARAEDQTRKLNAAMARIREEFRDGGPGAWRAYDTPRPPGSDGGDRDGGDPADERGWWETDYQRWYGYDRRSPFSRSGSPGGGGTEREWAPPHPNEDWFGTGQPDEIVPCPYCGATFDLLESFQAHLVADHQFRQTVYRAPRDWSFGLLDLIGKVRFLPLWIIVPMAVLLMWVLPFWAWPISWGFVAVVLWAQTSRRFRRDPYHR